MLNSRTTTYAMVASAIAAVSLFMGAMVSATPPVSISDKPRVPAAAIASVYSSSAPGANTDILSTAVTPDHDGSFYRVTVALATASVFNVTTTDGTQEFTHGLNSSVALQAGDMYTFSFSVRSALSYNFQVETDGVIRVLQVEEVVQEGAN